jgi:hypothetical protein
METTPQTDSAATTIAQKASLTAGNVFDSIINWVSLHPKTALVITIFLIGFAFGLLF